MLSVSVSEKLMIDRNAKGVTPELLIWLPHLGAIDYKFSKSVHLNTHQVCYHQMSDF